VQYKQTVL